MKDWNTIIYIFITGAALVMMGLGLWLVAIMPSIDRWSRRFFLIFFSVLFVNSCFALIDMLCFDIPDMALLRVILNFGMSLLTAFPLPALTMLLLHCCRENRKKSPLFLAVLALYTLYFILMVMAQFTTSIYFVTPEGRLCFGPLYPAAIAPLVAIGLMNLAGLLRRRDRMTRKHFLAMLISLLPLTAAMTIHQFVSVFPLIDFSITTSAFLMYCIILSDQIEQYMRQQREIARQQASIMVLQMRPHFIHNTLMSIYYLCQQDPREAQRVTLNFNHYLEKNLNALASDETIPFSEELEHTQAYLNVEQALYDENLFVKYDIPYTSFRVPPLTLQPIVENAVKHGLDPDSDPVCIFIQTRETDSGSEIIVSDNGPGFEPADNDKPHIALANIRQRLELICGGEITILPREGGGTVVKLTIPSLFCE